MTPKELDECEERVERDFNGIVVCRHLRLENYLKKESEAPQFLIGKIKELRKIGHRGMIGGHHPQLGWFILKDYFMMMVIWAENSIPILKNDDGEHYKDIYPEYQVR